ncbi:CHAP domain-containing protein [Nonomuraea lactucae]|uniref:CHAP domain-containing protein n=1 Tax=Nonomuraea lactucae TaxID=2249762 RepID=UPI000DE50136|nr:CHAP domain-containing protein [Nonomuraea lactucae]
MALHTLTRPPRTTLLRAALGATIALSAVSSAVSPASADVPEKAVPASASQERRPDKINVTAAQVIDLARAQVGTSENAYGGGTKFQRWYAGSQRALETIRRDGGARADYLNAAWCAMFVSWVGEQLGARPQVGWDAWTVAHARWFHANRRWGDEPKPGAVVFFSWSGGKTIRSIRHVGFVVKDNGDGTISTIEGNTGNGRVEERVRPKGQVVGYGYPEYAG